MEFDRGTQAKCNFEAMNCSDLLQGSRGGSERQRGCHKKEMED